MGLHLMSTACGAGPEISFRSKSASGVGARAPEVSGRFITGRGPRTLGEAAGRVVVVEIWTTYCDPCRRSFSRYEELTRKFGESIAVIAVSVDPPDAGTEARIVNFVEETGATFTILWDVDGVTKRAYRPSNLPTSYIIDQNATLAHVHAKYESGDMEVIAKEVEALLAHAP